MTIEGKIIQVLPLQGGVSKTSGKEWALQAYVLETLENYPKKVHFEVFGDDRIKANPCGVDDIVSVDFDIESREFNGRWYTSIRAWRIVKQDATQAAPQEAEQVSNGQESGTDLLANESSAGNTFADDMMDIDQPPF